VRVSQNPGAKIEEQKAEKTDSPKEAYFLFKFIKGPPSKLVVTLPPQKETVGDNSSAADSDKSVEGKSNKRRLPRRRT
jgi:hypothetical protein